MEQLTNPNDLLKQSESIPARDPVPDNPPRAWARINRTGLNMRLAAENHLAFDPEDPKAQSFDILKTRLVRQAIAKGYRRIGITSTTANCGKTLVAANLALSLSREKDFRSLVFDFDLRDPDLIDRFGLRRAGPRYSALRGTRRIFDSTALKLSDSTILSLNATAEPDAAQVLSSANTTQLLLDLEASFEPDLLLFDLPPLTPTADGLIALGLMDAALLVIEADKSTRQDVELGEKMIAEHSNCLGVILNRCRSSDPILNIAQ